jgi:hypothetical protein
MLGGWHACGDSETTTTITTTTTVTTILERCLFTEGDIKGTKT